MQCVMLQPNVTNNEVDSRMGLQQRSRGGHSPATHEDGGAGPAFDQEGFVAGLTGCRGCQNFLEISPTSAISPRHDTDLPSGELQVLDQCNDQWCFAAATCDHIADNDDGYWKS